MSSRRPIADEFFPHPPNHSGAAAVLQAANDLAARLGDRDEAILRELDAIDTQDRWEDET